MSRGLLRLKIYPSFGIEYTVGNPKASISEPVPSRTWGAEAKEIHLKENWIPRCRYQTRGYHLTSAWDIARGNN